MNLETIESSPDNLHLVHFRQVSRIPLGMKLEFECSEGFYKGKLNMYLLDSSQPWQNLLPKLTGRKHPTVNEFYMALYNPLLAKVERIKRKGNKPDLIAITDLYLID